MNTIDMIRAVQKALGVDVDGKPGPETWTAIYNRIAKGAKPAAVTRKPPGVLSGGKVDDRSERNIATLLPQVRPYARALVQKAAAAGVTIKIIRGAGPPCPQHQH